MQCSGIAILFLVVLWAQSVTSVIAQQKAGGKAEARDMRLLAHNELQARSAYQPVIHQQGGRFIAYIGHHGGKALNPMTEKEEPNGTSIVDVTDPRKPRYLYHLPVPPERSLISVDRRAIRYVRVNNAGSEV